MQISLCNVLQILQTWFLSSRMILIKPNTGTINLDFDLNIIINLKAALPEPVPFWFFWLRL